MVALLAIQLADFYGGLCSWTAQENVMGERWQLSADIARTCLVIGDSRIRSHDVLSAEKSLEPLFVPLQETSEPPEACSAPVLNIE